jgi:hypothetical protein
MEKGLSAVVVTRLPVCGLGLVLFFASYHRSFAQSVALPDQLVAQHQPQATIHVSEGKYTRYYHVLLDLRPQDFELTVPADQRRPRYRAENRYEFSDNGQFEIFVRKQAFPIPAPKCERYIIVRMPGTDPSTPDAADKLARKRALFNALEELKNSGAGQQAVAIELNPYVQVVRDDPLRLELTQCNAFLRHAEGAYIDHVRPLPK